MGKAQFGSSVLEAGDVHAEGKDVGEIREQLLKSRVEILSIASKVHKQIGLREASLDPDSAERGVGQGQWPDRGVPEAVQWRGHPARGAADR